MNAYWDTSALLKLIYLEPGSDHAASAQDQTEHAYSWDWGKVEAASGVARRGGRTAESSLVRLLSGLEWVVGKAADHGAIIKLCRQHRLRSADAGHLFYATQLHKALGDLRFVCFDNELTKAAKKAGLRVF